MAQERRDAMKPVEAQDGLQRWASCVRGACTCVGIMCAHLQGVMVWVSSEQYASQPTATLSLTSQSSTCGGVGVGLPRR